MRTEGTTRGQSSLFAGIAIAVWTAVVLGAASLASADERPSEINYDPPGTIPALRVGTLGPDHQRVVIFDHALRPRALVVDYGEPFGWESRSRAASRIVFEREVAGAMICHSLVNFSIHEDELRSSELNLTDVANFCELQPGRYRYRIVRADPGVGASRRLEGVVVVRPNLSAERTRQLSRHIPDWSESPAGNLTEVRGGRKGEAESLIAAMSGETNSIGGGGD